MYYKLFSPISYLALYLIQSNFLAATLPYNNYTQTYFCFLFFVLSFDLLYYVYSLFMYCSFSLIELLSCIIYVLFLI